MRKLAKYQTPWMPLPNGSFYDRPGGLISPSYAYATSPFKSSWTLLGDGSYQIGNGQLDPAVVTASKLNNAGSNLFDPLRSKYSGVGDQMRQQGLVAQNQMKQQIKDKYKGVGWQNFKEGIGGMINSVGNYAQPISTAMSTAAGLFGLKPDEDSSYSLEQGVGNALVSSGNPYAAAAGLWVKGSSMLNQALGTNTNTLNKKQTDTVGMTGFGKLANNTLGFLANTIAPGVGGLIKKTNDVYKSQEVDELRGAYAGSADFIDTMGTMGGKRYAVGRGKINSGIDQSNQWNDMMTSIGLDNKPRIQSAQFTSRDFMQQDFNRKRGKNYQDYSLTVGKEGLKLLSKEELQRIYSSRKTGDLQAFGDGGKIGVDTNVIPEGALHAHKNNLEETNPELDEVTEKGIPVIVTDSNGDYTQVAEIEKEELVLSKSLTDQIEKLWKENTPESMIEAGKLLAVEIMENTQDNTEEMLDGND